MEFLIILIAWILPLGAVVFVISALWQILRGVGAMTAELTKIRELLEEDR